METQHTPTPDGLAPTSGSPSSDTPETDRLEYEQECNYEVGWEDHSRKLERQRDDARRDRDEWKASAARYHQANDSLVKEHSRFLAAIRQLVRHRGHVAEGAVIEKLTAMLPENSELNQWSCFNEIHNH